MIANSQNNNSTDSTSTENKTTEEMWRQSLKASLQILLLTLLIIAMFGFVGYMIGKIYNVTTLATIAAVIISFPVTQVLLLKKFKNLSLKK